MKKTLDMWRRVWSGTRQWVGAVRPRRAMGWLAMGAACVVTAVLIGVVLLWGVGRAGNSSAVERWVQEQVQSVAQGYLKPRLEIGSLKYIWPKTVVLKDVHLTADGPGGAKDRVDIAAVKSLTLELGEIPHAGQPIVIEQLILDEPVVRCVAMSATDGRLVGYSDLLVGSGEAKGAGSAAATAAAPAGAGSRPAAGTQVAQASAAVQKVASAPAPAAAITAPAAPALSSVFAITLLEIKDGSVEYDSRRPGEAVMNLTHLNTALHVKASMDGWYGMDFGIALAPIFDLKIKGQWNIDTMLAKVESLEMGMKAGRDNDHYLPPALQAVLKEHEAAGELSIKGAGTIPLMDVLSGDAHATVTLAQGHLAGGNRQVAVQQMECELAMRDGRAEMPHFSLDGGSGHVKGTAHISWGPGGQAGMQIALDGAKLEETVRDSNDKRAGVVSGAVQWMAPTRAMGTQATGGGEIHIRQGRLVDVPLMKQIKEAMKIIKLGSDQANDTADVLFDFKGDRVHVNKLAISTDVMAARGGGDILFNGSLDLELNGGPLEKVQEKLGVVGEVMGAVTDQVARYQVKGTWGDPKVGMTVGPRL